MSDERAVVAHVVFPVTAAEQVLPLYVDGDATAATVLDRRRIRVVGGRVSLGSYFNAFPAAYWAAETAHEAVRLAVRASGTGEVRVVRSDADAVTRVVDRRAVDGSTEYTVDVPLTGSADGGALWIDLAGGDDGLTLESAEWSVPGTARATASVAMATFNRPTDCHAQLRAIAEDPDMADVIDRIVVADQGGDLVADQPGFAETAAALGDRLLLVRQRNLGGSGGFSRGMLEALEAGTSDAVLLLDDDAISEPEAIFRAVRFADAAREPVIVGGGMLHLDRRSVLYTQSEQWDRRIGWVRLDREGAYDHDFAAVPFRDARFFHRRQTSDFNGWWMCLIPLALLRETGLSMPLFLKGDDVEFGLRAGAAGVRTVSPPGIALWHMGWGGKAPTRTWEAYFLHRNRLITEVLHNPDRRATRMLLHSFLGDLKPLLTLQYSAVRLRALAAVDVLAGPERLPGWLDARAGEVRALWSQFTDAMPVSAPDDADAPAPAPAGRAAQAATLLRVAARHLLRAERPATGRAVRVPARALGWWTFASIDAAYVDTADGAAVVRYVRSRRETLRALGRSIRLHATLWWRWPRLARRYRSAAPELTSPRAWSRIFGRG
ncbi:glycosyltransferase [Microbacterium sp. GXF7504]